MEGEASIKVKKTTLFCFSLILGLFLISCQSSNKQINHDDHISVEQEDELSSDQIENIQPDMLLKKVATKERTRTIEGMDEAVQVNQYEILPYQISYELDVFFGEPEVHQNEVIYVSENDQFEIKVEINEQMSFDETINKLQENLMTQNEKHLSELQAVPVDENNLTGKMQNTTDPMQGFYVYDLDYYVFIITYKYPVEGGDGMGPLLESLRRSIKVK